MEGTVDHQLTPRLIPINISKTKFLTYPPPPLIVDWEKRTITQPGSLLPKENIPGKNLEAADNSKEKLFKNSKKISLDNSAADTSHNSSPQLLNLTFTKRIKRNTRNLRKEIFNNGKNPSPRSVRGINSSDDVQEYTRSTPSKAIIPLKKRETVETAGITPTRRLANSVLPSSSSIAKTRIRMNSCAPTSSPRIVLPSKEETSRNVTARQSRSRITAVTPVSRKFVTSKKEKKGESTIPDTSRRTGGILRTRMASCVPSFTPSTIEIREDTHGIKTNHSNTSRRPAVNSRARMNSCVPSFNSRKIVPLKGDPVTRSPALPRRTVSFSRTVTSSPATTVSSRSLISLKKDPTVENTSVTPTRKFTKSVVPSSSSVAKTRTRMNSCVPSLPSRVILPYESESDKKENQPSKPASVARSYSNCRSCCSGKKSTVTATLKKNDSMKEVRSTRTKADMEKKGEVTVRRQPIRSVRNQLVKRY